MSLAIIQACNTAELSKQQWRVMGAILEKTLGYNKWSDDISFSQLAQISRIRRDKIYTILKTLEAHNLIITQKGKYGRIITIHPNHQTHFNQPKTTPPKEPETGLDSPPKQVQTQPQNGSTTIKTTTNKTTTRDVAGGELDNQPLNYPKQLTLLEVNQAKQKLDGITPKAAQDILTLLNQALESNRVTKSKIGYLCGLIKRHRSGTLEPLQTNEPETYIPTFGIQKQGAEDTPAARRAHDLMLEQLLRQC